LVLIENKKYGCSGNHSVYRVLIDFDIHTAQAHNPKVAGSSPVPATRKIKASQKCEAFFFGAGTT
jgi:hypothetical protein